MSRDHRSAYTAVALLEKNKVTIEPGSGGRHRDMTRAERRAARRVETAVTAILPVVDPDTLDLVVQLDAMGADVRVIHGRGDAGHCTSCQMRHAVADVRIYDGPAYDEVCRECAPKAVKVATTDDVKVEVLA